MRISHLTPVGPALAMGFARRIGIFDSNMLRLEKVCHSLPFTCRLHANRYRVGDPK
jgi:hypothetical protein